MAVKKKSNKAKRTRDALLGAIKAEQAASGFISGDAFADIAQSFKLPVSDVYGVATFYSFISTEPVGRHVIRICKSVPCCLEDAETIIEGIQKELGIGPGQTTPDGRFSLELTHCIGACDRAPAMLVDDEVYGDLTPDKLVDILRSFA